MQKFTVTFDCNSFAVDVAVEAPNRTQARHSAVVKANKNADLLAASTLSVPGPFVGMRVKPVRFRPAMIVDVVQAK